MLVVCVCVFAQKCERCQSRVILSNKQSDNALFRIYIYIHVHTYMYMYIRVLYVYHISTQEDITPAQRLWHENTLTGTSLL